METTIMKTLQNLNDENFNYYFLTGGCFLLYLVYRIIHSFMSDNNFLHTKFRARGHAWRSIECNKSIPYNIYCTICGKLMLPLVGLFCECCAVSACRTRCHRIVEKKTKCKPLTWPKDRPFHHQWVNVGQARGETSDQEAMNKFYCCWCHRVKITYDNSLNNTELCDFLKYRNIIIPPTSVNFEKGVISNIDPVDNDEWEPLIVFANRKSGSNRSDEILSLFRGLLNPIQVIDLAETAPESVVRWLPARCRVLAAGGDGTVAWLLNALHDAPHVKAGVAILPMGTGNDLSRVLGWGPGCPSHLDAHAVIAAVRQAEEVALDRWKVSICPRGGRLRRRTVRCVHAYNYASVGVDAQVALDFHRARAQFLYRFASRTLNYMAYMFLGAGRAVAAGCGALERRVSVRADGGAALRLPPLQALVALNIPSWGAGVPLWSMGSEDDMPDQSINDGKLEIVGISSSIHIARLQCGLAEPYRFTQASSVKIELEAPCAMQVDGEPWMQGPASISLELAGQARVLRAPHH